MQTPLVPTTTTLDQVPLIEKKKALAIAGGQDALLSWTMVDDFGEPIDITAYVPSGTTPAPDPVVGANPLYMNITQPFPPVIARVAESALNTRGYVNIFGTITDPTNGVVQLTIDARKQLPPAIYDMDIGVIDPASGYPGYVNRVYLICEKSGFSNGQDCGPPTRRDIRLHMRDSSAAEQRLLDNVQFDDAEIADAITHAIEFWNNALPPIAPADTSNFPFSYWWMEAIVAHLYEVASRWYMTNKLTASAGGVQVNDMDKSQECAQMAALGWQNYAKWVQSKKVAINAMGCFGHVSSPYGLRGWSGLNF